MRTPPKDKELRRVENELDDLERRILFHNTQADRLMERYQHLCQKYGVVMYGDGEVGITKEQKS